jgi:hypothetical protein
MRRDQRVQTGEQLEPGNPMSLSYTDNAATAKTTMSRRRCLAARVPWLMTCAPRYWKRDIGYRFGDQI